MRGTIRKQTNVVCSKLKTSGWGIASNSNFAATLSGRFWIWGLGVLDLGVLDFNRVKGHTCPQMPPDY